MQNKNQPKRLRRLRNWVSLIVMLAGVVALTHTLQQEALQKGCLAFPTPIPMQNEFAQKQEIRLVALGDWGTMDGDQKQVAQGMKSVCQTQGCDLGLFLGDNFYPNGVTSVNDPHWEHTFSKVYHALNIPFYAIVGNHDVKENIAAQVVYSLKDTQWRMPDYHYAFKAGPASFLAFNSECHLLGYWKLGALLNWHDSSNWLLALGHRPVYGSGTHGDSDWLSRFVWKHWFEAKVDFLLSGHNHHLEWLEMQGHRTTYLISGAGGKHYRDPGERQRSRPSRATQRFVHQDTGFLWMRITTQQAEFQFFDANGQRLIAKIHNR